MQHNHHLLLIVGPAGYGKTTLVVDWLSRTGLLHMLPAMPQSHGALVNPLINDIAASDPTFVPALDDCRAITSAPVQEATNFLLETWTSYHDDRTLD